MFTKFKKFYEDHQEAIVASAISALVTGTTVAAVSVVKYRQVKFNRFEIWTPDDIKDLEGKTLELALYMKNGKVAVLPAPYLDTPPQGSIAPI